MLMFFFNGVKIKGGGGVGKFLKIQLISKGFGTFLSESTGKGKNRLKSRLIEEELGNLPLTVKYFFKINKRGS